MRLRVVIVAGALIFSQDVFPQAAAQSRGTETCRTAATCGKGAGGSGSSKNSARSNGAAAIGLGAAILLQGLANSSNDSVEEELQENRRRYESEIRKADRNAVAAESNAKGAAAANPWGNSQTEKQTKAQPNDSRAPYASLKCADIRQSGSGISWDSTTIFNKCSFPIQVLTCYYDKGQRQTCDNFTAGRWGTSSTIGPNGSTGSVSSSKKPGFGVRFFVCNMGGIKKNEKLCLLPKA